ncbi:MAG: 50S ribosome-binding GTPase [Candidatus Thiosymbion ectosymbiont of Robbea hypermnestra]|nr:50S ribosome-binding GTPase [Candidatus Thiosymbion ectosymbiont of Robbea hypermnestra]
MNINDIMSSMIRGIRELNPDIPQDEFEGIGAKVKEKVRKEPPPTIAIIGESGVGKSLTLNALFNAGQDVSHTEACTQQESAILLKGDKGSIVVYDMPGLSESISSQSRHLSTYEKVLKECDVALWIFDAQNRAIANIQKLLANEISSINSEIVSRMVFAVNKIDLVHPGAEAWISRANLPSEEQEINIKARLYDIQNKMKDAVPNWHGQIVGYSSQKRYNLPQLFASMLDGVSHKRQWVLSSRKALADYFELVDPELLPVERRPNKDMYTGNKLSPSNQGIERRLRQLSDQEYDELVKDKSALTEWIKKSFNLD